MNIQSDNVPKVKKDTKESSATLFSDQIFLKTKLKPLLINGRESKPIKSLARQLGIPENELHEHFKKMDTEGTLPYGYYDKIERIYVRTHIEEEIDETLLLDLINKSYGYKTFHHQSLASNLLTGRQITPRNVLNSLHQLRKQGKIIGFRKGDLWLWKLPNPNEEEETLTENDTAQMHENEGTETEVDDTGTGSKKGSYYRKKNIVHTHSYKQHSHGAEEDEDVAARTDEMSEKNTGTDKDIENEGTSLADLVRWNNSTHHDVDEEDDYNDFEIVFSDDDDEEEDT